MMAYRCCGLGRTSRAVGPARVAGGCAPAAGRGLAQRPPQIGIAPVTVSDQPYVFDTAEQHKVRVVVVARGRSHPLSLAFLPNGDALVTERGARLRIVRGAVVGVEG